MKTTKSNFTIATLRQFNAVLEGNKKSHKLLENHGVFVAPSAYHELDAIHSYLAESRSHSSTLNKTFHKSWNKIINSSREELFIDQIMHYMSTYGTDHTGVVYIPDEVLDTENKTMPVRLIQGWSKDKIVQSTEDMLSSGVALKEETIRDLLSILGYLDYNFDNIDWVKNKEARMIIMDKHSVQVSDPVEAIRYVVYKSTDSTLLIKNRETIDNIANDPIDINGLFNSIGLEKMATVFNRFKPLFLALKSKKSNVSTINRISKLSKTLHVPMAENALNHATSKKITKKEMHWLDNATPYALFKALNACKLRAQGQSEFVYKIRNGKSWVSEGKSNPNVAISNYTTIISSIRNRLGERFDGKKVYIPEGVSYGLPTSEKMFVDNIPMGTKVSKPSLAVGVYCENNMGATDLDLSGMSLSGKIGWNSAYSGYGVSYSGDMTNARDGATEYLYGSDTSLGDTLVLINCFSGNEDDHTYDIIVGEGDRPSRSYMMNPENLIFKGSFKSTSRQSYVGVMYGDGEYVCFALYPRCGSSARVSNNSDTVATTARNALLNEAKNSMTLNELLEELGATIVHDSEDVDIDLGTNVIDKTSLISLFS